MVDGRTRGQSSGNGKEGIFILSATAMWEYVGSEWEAVYNDRRKTPYGRERRAWGHDNRDKTRDLLWQKDQETILGSFMR